MGKSKAKNWKSRILRYSGQFILIFVSVFLAFSLSEWGKNKEELHSEIELLKTMKKGLHSDIEELVLGDSILRQVYHSYGKLRKHVANPELPEDSTIHYFSGVLSGERPFFNSAAYESLKTSGLKVIKDHSLREAIILLYEYDYKIIEELNLLNYTEKRRNKLIEIFQHLLQYNEDGYIVEMESLSNLTVNQRKEAILELSIHITDVISKVQYYNVTIEKQRKLVEEIDNYLDGK